MAFALRMGDRWDLDQENDLLVNIKRLQLERDNLSKEIELKQRDAELDRREEKNTYDAGTLEDRLTRQAEKHGTDLMVANAEALVKVAEAKAAATEAVLAEKQAQFDKMAKLVSDAADARVKTAEERAKAAEKMVEQLMTHLPKVSLDGGLNVNVKSECKK